MDEHSIKTPSPLLSLIPVFVLVGLLFFTIHTFGSDALAGGSQVALLIATAVGTALAIGYCGIRWKVIELAIVNNITGVATALLILLIIGALSGSWMLSGIIPTMIYYGIQIIHPDYFLVSTCLICAVVSLMTGSSWTTIATIGVALLGVGQAQGFSEGWIAGAIISGSYFGDKMSPLSDTTVLASSVTDTSLFTHIRYMVITTVPALIIAVVIYTIFGLSNSGTFSTEHIAIYAATLKSTFIISPWLLVVPVVTGFLIAKRIPTLITLFISAMLAGILAIIFQPHLLNEVAGAETTNVQSVVKGLFMTWYGPTGIETGNSNLNELVSTHGMNGMMNTIWLILCAMCFGGVMTASGMLGSITSLFLRFMKNTVSTVASTVASGILLNLTTSDQYISIILNGNMFREVYKQKGYESRLLSRATEDGVTVISPLIPWNSCGMTQATILGVATFTYLPYSFFNLLCPFMSILIAATGYKIYRTNEKDQDISTR